jgi:hypothetical protein
MAEFRAWKLTLESSEARSNADAPGFDAAQAKDIVSGDALPSPPRHPRRPDVA